MGNAMQVPVNEPDPFAGVTQIPSSSNMAGKLRVGYTIQVGADAADPASFMKGPADVPLTPKIAVDHMVKWENVGAIKAWLRKYHMPWLQKNGYSNTAYFRETPVRLSPEQQLDKNVEKARDINRKMGAARGGVTLEQVNEIVTEACSKMADAIVARLGRTPVAAARMLTDDEVPQRRARPAGKRAPRFNTGKKKATRGR